MTQTIWMWLVLQSPFIALALYHIHQQQRRFQLVLQLGSRHSHLDELNQGQSRLVYTLLGAWLIVFIWVSFVFGSQVSAEHHSILSLSIMNMMALTLVHYKWHQQLMHLAHQAQRQSSCCTQARLKVLSLLYGALITGWLSPWSLLILMAFVPNASSLTLVFWYGLMALACISYARLSHRYQHHLMPPSASL